MAKKKQAPKVEVTYKATDLDGTTKTELLQGIGAVIVYITETKGQYSVEFVGSGMVNIRAVFTSVIHNFIKQVGLMKTLYELTEALKDADAMRIDGKVVQA